MWRVDWSVACFLLLAAYVTLESAHALWTRERAARSIAGILIAIAAVIVMPLLGRAKRRVAVELGSRALHSDSRQADFCAYLSAILLVGLLLNTLFGWWWADPSRRAGDGSDHRSRGRAGVAG